MTKAAEVISNSKQPKSKEELAQLRKAMMKRKEPPVVVVQQAAPVTEAQKFLERLACGRKPEVDRKEMKRLT